MPAREVTAHGLRIATRPVPRQARTGTTTTIELEVGTVGEQFRSLGVRVQGLSEGSALIASHARWEQFDEQSQQWVPMSWSSLGSIPAGETHRARVGLPVPDQMRTDRAAFEVVVWDLDEPDERYVTTEPVKLSIHGDVEVKHPIVTEVPDAERSGLRLSMDPAAHAVPAGHTSRYHLELGNLSDERPRRLGVRVEPVGEIAPAAESWLAIEPSRVDLRAGASDGLDVTLHVPEGSPSGPGAFRVVVWDLDEPDESYVRTAPVRFRVPDPRGRAT